MKKIIIFSIFFSFFLVFFSGAKERKESSNLLSEKITNILAKEKTKIITKKDFQTKEEILGKGYKKHPDAKFMRKKLVHHIYHISKLCTKNMPLNKKISQLNNDLQILQKITTDYLQKYPYLSVKDSIFLRSIKNNLSKEALSMGEQIDFRLVKEKKLDLKNNFLLSYRNYYNLSKNIKDIPHLWAQKVYKGLSCL